MLDKSSESKSAVRLVFIVAIFVFLGEALVMIFMPLIPFHSNWLSALTDASMLIIILAPALYFGLFRSLLQIIERKTKSGT